MSIAAADIGASISLPPEDAIRFLQAKGAQVTGNWTEWLDGQHARAFTVANVTKLDVLQDIQTSLDKALKGGQTLQQWKDGLIPELQRKGWWRREGSTAQLQAAGRVDAEGVIAKGLTPYRLKTIYQTNMQSAYMAGRYAQMIEQAEERPYWQYVAILDSKTRPAHRALNGKVFRYDDAGWGAFYPPNGFNCFLPGTQIRGKALLGLKAFYSGPAVEITTAKGHRLAVTVNHPVLTARGWLDAGSLTEGDHLVCDLGRVDAAPLIVVDHQQPPVLAEDLFETIAGEVLGVAEVAPADLHGDAQFVQGEVHVAVRNTALADEQQAAPAQLIAQRLLGRADVVAGVQTLGAEGPALGGSVGAERVGLENAADVGIARAEHGGDLAARQQRVLVERANALFEVGVAVARGLPGLAELTLDERRALLEAGPFEALGITLAAQLDATNLEDAAQRVAAVAEVFGQLVEAGAGAVGRDQVIGVRHFNWTGHVYDFQTDSGLLFADGILVHNCRCRVRNFSQSDIERRKIPLSSTEGKLRQVQVPLKSGETATVTRLVDRSLPGGKFQPDAGFSNNPGLNAWQPRLEGADVQLSRRYIDTAMQGPAFEAFVAGKAQGAFPVAKLRPQDQTRLQADTSVAYLSGETLAKQAAKHPEVTLDDYRRIPDIVDQGESHAQAGNRLVFLFEEGTVWRLALKATKARHELFVLSLFKTTREKALREIKNWPARK